MSSKPEGRALDGGVRASFDVRKLRCRVVSLGDLRFHNRLLSCGFVCEGVRWTGLPASREIATLAFRPNSGPSAALDRHLGFQNRPFGWRRARSTITFSTAGASLLRGLRPIVERRRPSERGYWGWSASFRALLRLWKNFRPRRHVEPALFEARSSSRAPAAPKCVSLTYLRECGHCTIIRAVCNRERLARRPGERLCLQSR